MDNAEITKFFDKMPEALTLYMKLEEEIHNQFENVTIKVHKSQISFSCKHGFAYVWLPIHRVKGRPENYIVVSFGLNHQINHPRIEEAVESYSNRWIHHVIIENLDQIDIQLMEWLEEAYLFSLNKN